MAKKKGKKKAKGKKNPAAMTVTNAAGKKGKKKKARRNPKGFIARSFDQLGQDAKLALPNLGGRYAGEVLGAVGNRYLGTYVPAGLAGIAGMVIGHIGLTKFAGNSAAMKQVRIGLLSEAMHQTAVETLGIDAPGIVLDMLPGGEEVEETTEEVETETGITPGPEGLGALQTIKNQVSGRMYMRPDYSI